MNHELAQKLKDAGFPQIRGIAVEAEGKSMYGVYFPDLSELIESCSDKFLSLHRSNQKVPSWMAFGTVEPTISFDSPEEAVANLWLALNKKLT